MSYLSKHGMKILYQILNAGINLDNTTISEENDGDNCEIYIETEEESLHLVDGRYYYRCDTKRGGKMLRLVEFGRPNSYETTTCRCFFYFFGNTNDSRYVELLKQFNK